MKRLAILVGVTACGVNLTPQPENQPERPSCVPDRDGQITADELPIAYGATVAYYASPPGVTRPVTLGAANGVWDLSAENRDDIVIELGPIPLKDQWYAASFPAGQFVVDGGGNLDGIYHQDDQALWLDGTASRDPAPANRTLIRYTQPVAVLRFPIADGDAFTTTAQIADGLVSGLPFIGTDEVAIEVAGEGRVDVPYVRFSPALQVRTLVTRKPSTGTPVVTRRNVIFLFECFGEVARAESRQDEPSPEFTTAAYLRRFALGVTP
ncbi:MAG: hypothetical protein H0T42_01230 [Deltaproteobacteria bacterium]|nr:hypothetical protein [Deltaproteobacteria bacterium]